VPDDHPEPTVRCGICWTEVPVGPRPTPPPVAPPTAILLPPKPAAASGVNKLPPGVRLADPLPAGGRPAAGMAPLEALVQRAAARLAPPAPARPADPPIVEVPVVVAEVVTAAPPAPPPVVVPAAPPAVPVLAKARDDRPRPRDPDDDGRKPRFRARDEDEDEDDEDDDLPRRGRTTRTGPLVAVIAGGAVTLVAVLAGVFFVVRGVGDGSAAPTATAPAADPGRAAANPLPQFQPPADPPAGGGFAPAPGAVNDPRKPFPDPEWRAVAGADGFAAEVLGDARDRPNPFERFHDPAQPFARGQGKAYTSHGPWFEFEVRYADAPKGVSPDLPKMMAHPFGKAERAAAADVAGHPGFELVEQDQFRTDARRAVRVGCRVFVFRAELRNAFGRTAADADAARKRFFDSIKITFDPATPPPDDPAVRPRRGAADPFPGGFGEDDGRLRTVARIDPFLAAVVLPGRGELLTVGLRPGSRTLGVLRVYTYPGFVPTHAYHLPAAGTAAVASERLGKLALTSVKLATDSPAREADRAIVTGDVHLFDLNPVFRGDVGERDELRPAATVGLNAKLAGLVTDPAGTTAYALSMTPTAGAKGRPYRTRVTRIDLADGKATGELELPDPAWRLAVSADGAKLYAAEVPVTPAGQPLLAVARVANVLVIDRPGWRRERTLTTPGAAFDLCPTPDGTLFASVTQPGGFRGYAVPADGQTVDLTPEDGRPVSLGYAAVTADGKRLVTSAQAGQGLQVYAVAGLGGPDGLTRVGAGRLVPGPRAGEPAVPVGGAFALSPDGKYAILNAGVVVGVGG
jgi:hypothetical protein